MAAGVLAASWLVAPVAVRRGLASVGLGFRHLGAALWPVVVASSSMAAATTTLLLFGRGAMPDTVLLISQVLGGALVYAGVVAAVGRPLLKDLVQVSRGRGAA